MRKIIHIDMDAFFASIEQRDDPALAGRPIAVGGSSRRGVVAAASYEARAYGVHSALPSQVAARRCPDLIFVPPRFDVYRDVSRQIRAIFHTFSDLVEPLSLDEAYLDVSEPKQGPPSGTIIAATIRRQIREETQLTASAGVSFNKFLAKVASDVRKPDGMTVITPADADAFLTALPIERFFGVGPVSAARLREVGIHSGGDLRARSLDELVQQFGKRGRYLFDMAHGRDDRPVQTDHVRKSIGAERTFMDDLTDVSEMDAALARLVDRVMERIGRDGRNGTCVTVKIRYQDFETLTRQTTLSQPISNEAALLERALHLLRTPHLPLRPVRLLGVTVSGFLPDDIPASQQLTLPLQNAQRGGAP